MKQSCADKRVSHKNNQRKQEQGREDSQNIRQYQINRHRPVSLPSVLFTSVTLLLHRVAHNTDVLYSHSLTVGSTDTNGTMQRVGWHFTLLHKRLHPPKNTRLQKQDMVSSEKKEVS